MRAVVRVVRSTRTGRALHVETETDVAPGGCLEGVSHRERPRFLT